MHCQDRQNGLAGRSGSLRAAEIAKLPLLHLRDKQDWINWFRAAGLNDIGPLRGPVLDQDNMIIDAAVDGQGVGLARTTLASWDLIAGRLVRPSPIALAVPYAYWVVCPKAAAALPKIVTFRAWLLAEAERDKGSLDEMR